MSATTRPRSALSAPRNGCVGWEDDDAVHHGCTTDDFPILARGRCTRCYTRNNAVERRRKRQEEDRSPSDPLRGRRSAPALVDSATVAAPVPPPDPAPPRGGWQPDPEFAPVTPDDFGDEDVPHAPAAATLAPDWRERPAESLAAAVLPPPPAPPAPAETYAWTVFDQPPHIVVPTAPTITLAKDGGCRLNSLAYGLWGREVAAVEVLYDQTRRAVALRPCDPALPHARRLRTDKGSRHCSLRAFRRATGLLAGGTVAVVPRLVAPDLIVFDLPRATEPGR